jgi:hypothetical protein
MSSIPEANTNEPKQNATTHSENTHKHSLIIKSIIAS